MANSNKNGSKITPSKAQRSGNTTSSTRTYSNNNGGGYSKPKK